MEDFAVFPGWPRLNAELNGAANSGEGVMLSAVEALTVLGEVERLNRQLERAQKILQQVKNGTGCWQSAQGYMPCEHPGVEAFLRGSPKRRWWRQRQRGTNT